MAQPTPYVPAVGFQAEETAAVAGRSTVRTAMLDAELQAVALTLSQVLANLSVIQRDDTGLRDLVVTTESLSANVRTLMGSAGVLPRGLWLTATSYAVKDAVETGSPLVSYICVTAHTSGTFAVDRAAGKWMVLGEEPGAGAFTSISISTGGITLGTNNTQDLAATANRFRSGYFGTTVFAGVSVITPLVQSTGAVDLVLGANGGTDWNIASTGKHWLPGADNTQNLGSATKRAANLFTPIIDSGTTGSVSIKTNNGTISAVFNHTASAVNFLSYFAGATGVDIDLLAGGETNVGIFYATKGNRSHNFYTGGTNDSGGSAVQQVEILHTASASRRITLTGSNGGNPTISTTAGSLAITPAVVMASSLTLTGALILGASPAPSGTLRMPYGANIAFSSSDNLSALTLAAASTQNGVIDTIHMGDGSNGIYFRSRSGGAAPTASDLPASFFTVWRDTGGATTKLYYNNAGAIMSVALA